MKNLLLIFLFTFLATEFCHAQTILFDSPSNNSVYTVTSGVTINIKVNFTFTLSGGTITYITKLTTEQGTTSVNNGDIVNNVTAGSKNWKLEIWCWDGSTYHYASNNVSFNVVYGIRHITADNNFTDNSGNGTHGSIVIDGISHTISSNGYAFTKNVGDNTTLQAVSPQTDNQGYQRVWNTSGVSQSLSSWQQLANYHYNFKTYNSQYNFTVAPTDDGTTFISNLMKACDITIQNNFIGVGHGNTITVNNNLVSSPSSNNMVVEQNAITASALNVISINGIDYTLNNWTDANNNILSTNNSVTFNPSTNMTYTANFTGTPPSNIINFGFNNTVNQPIQMYWTDNPNPNVTYQIWRNIKGGSGPVLLATIGRGVQTYTDYDYLYTSTYTNNLLYYDVRQYYSVEGTYSNPTWHAVYGKISPKEDPNKNLTLSTESENITNYFVGCYPNPFNPATIINYQLPKAGAVTLKIYDSMGREIKTLVNETKDKGSYNVSFNASSLPSGIYFYQLRSGDYISTKKMVLLK